MKGARGEGRLDRHGASPHVDIGQEVGHEMIVSHRVVGDVGRHALRVVLVAHLRDRLGARQKDGMVGRQALQVHVLYGHLDLVTGKTK